MGQRRVILTVILIAAMKREKPGELGCTRGEGIPRGERTDPTVLGTLLRYDILGPCKIDINFGGERCFPLPH